MIFPTYELDCKNAAAGVGPHRIDLPLPSDLTLGGAPPSRDHIRDVAFACPICRHIHSYDGVELRHRVHQADITALPPVPVPVRIRTRCQHPGCQATITVYTTRNSSESKQDALERLRRATFHIHCANGHRPSFAQDQPFEVTDGPLCNPF